VELSISLRPLPVAVITNKSLRLLAWNDWNCFSVSDSLGLWTLAIVRNSNQLPNLWGLLFLRGPTEKVLWKQKKSSFRSVVFSSNLEFWMMGKVHKPSDSSCYTPSSEPYRFYCFSLYLLICLFVCLFVRNVLQISSRWNGTWIWPHSFQKKNTGQSNELS
jgi:hypothetical protein